MLTWQHLPIATSKKSNWIQSWISIIQNETVKDDLNGPKNHRNYLNLLTIGEDKSYLDFITNLSRSSQ